MKLSTSLLHRYKRLSYRFLVLYYLYHHSQSRAAVSATNDQIGNVPYCRQSEQAAAYTVDEFKASWPQAPFASRPCVDDHRTNELTPRSFRRLWKA